jgi:hypothetical protein
MMERKKRKKKNGRFFCNENESLFENDQNEYDEENSEVDENIFKEEIEEHKEYKRNKYNELDLCDGPYWQQNKDTPRFSFLQAENLIRSQLQMTSKEK